VAGAVECGKDKGMMYPTGSLPTNTVQGWTLGPTIDELLQLSHDDGSRASRTLVKSKDMTVLLTALAKGQELKEHRAAASVMVIALRGEMVFRCEGVSNTLGGPNSGVLAMGKNQPHSVEALSDSAFLLVMGPVEHTPHA
jgi:quercetin dioxygenase-like cupin family protein